MVSVEVYEDRFQKLKDVDLGKDKVIEDLINEVKEFDRSLKEKKLHLEREQETTKLFQSKHSNVQVKLKRIKDAIGFNGYVSVLIDGDHMLFVDNLIESAKEGGMNAARHLRSKVSEYASNELGLPNHIHIRVRVYANKKGLAATYCQHKILNSMAEFDAFVRGFNMGHPMSDFIDAGDEKECADSKLKAWFDHDIADIQCRAVLFGGSADSGYARILDPCVGENSKDKKIVLIEGPSFVKDLARLKDKFPVVSFSDVLRGTNLQSQRVSFSTTPPATPIQNAMRVAVNADLVSTTVVRPDDSHSFPVPVPARKEYPMLQNSRGQRLDAKISPPQSLVKALSNKKHCNPFHILGECSLNHCNFLHGERLDEKGIEARRLLSRSKPCPSGLLCADEKCLRGHQCPDKACARVGSGCVFAPAMHNVDRN